MLKRIVLLVSACLTGMLSFAQQTHAPISAKDVNHFFETKTYVVLDDNPMSDYNAKIEEQVKKHWKVTPFEFISQEQFNLKRTDPNNSFLILSRVVFTEDPLQAQYDFFSLMLGGNFSTLNAMPYLSAVPLGYTEAPQESSAYKLGALLKFAQAHVQMLKEHPENIDNDNMFSYYNKAKRSVQDKTLYLVKEEMAPEFNSERKVATIYPYKVKFVTRDELEKIIDNAEPNAVFLHKVGPENTKRKARCFKAIIGTDNLLYYFDWHMIKDSKPDGLLESDFKKLAKFKNE